MQVTQRSYLKSKEGQIGSHGKQVSDSNQREKRKGFCHRHTSCLLHMVHSNTIDDRMETRYFRKCPGIDSALDWG